MIMIFPLSIRSAVLNFAGYAFSLADSWLRAGNSSFAYCKFIDIKMLYLLYLQVNIERARQNIICLCCLCARING